MVVEELTNGLTSVEQINQVLQSGAQDAFETFHEAVKEVEVEVAEIMGLPTPTTVTVRNTVRYRCINESNSTLSENFNYFNNSNSNYNVNNKHGRSVDRFIREILSVHV